MPVDEGYRKQAALLVRTVPLVAVETCFALKGGTAINLFLRDMPRLSVDIDLTYVPVADRSIEQGKRLWRKPSIKSLRVHTGHKVRLS